MQNGASDILAIFIFDALFDMIQKCVCINGAKRIVKRDSIILMVNECGAEIATHVRLEDFAQTVQGDLKVIFGCLRFAFGPEIFHEHIFKHPA